MRNKNQDHIKLIVRIAVLTALVSVVTIVNIPIPIPGLSGAYMNAGDAIVYTCAYMLGGTWGAVAAGIGSAAADLLLGSVIYAPATLIIKGLMAFITGWLMARGSGSLKGRLLALAIGGAVMPLGYFLYESILYGPAPAAAGLPFNLVQYVGGVVLGLFLVQAVDRVLGRKGEA